MLNVNTPTDWRQLTEDGLQTVVDPMVYRVAERFLRGKPSDPKEAATVWSAIGKNVDALALFFDQVMLNDKLPVFDYGVSWEPELTGGAASVIEVCNLDEELLVDVRVDGGAYGQAKDAAVAALAAQPQISDVLARDVLAELSALDYAWRPWLPGAETMSDDERTLASFRFGGLLFSRYATELWDEDRGFAGVAEHVIQPKRSRLGLALSLAPGGDLRLDEDRLYERLAEAERESQVIKAADDVPNVPTFLPYLLSFNPRSPQELLRIALRERKTRPAQAYREFREGVREDLAVGRIRPKTRREIGRIAAMVRRRLATPEPAEMRLHYAIPLSPTAVIQAVAGAPTALVPELKLEGEVGLGRLQDWVAASVPGRAYRKLLTRLVATRAEYFDLDRAVQDLWIRGRQSR